MTVTTGTTSTGSFTTARRNGAAAEYDFIVAQLERGVSVQNIARMTGCSMHDVSKIKERVNVEA